MIRTARRRFPAQERAYENVKRVLLGQITLVQPGLEATAA